MNVVRKVRVCVMMAQFSSCPQLCTLHNFSCCRLPTQLFTTSETGETFSILKTLFKSLAGAEPGCLACCCSCWCWCWLSSSPLPNRVLLRENCGQYMWRWIFGYTQYTPYHLMVLILCQRSKLKTKSNFQGFFSDMIGNYWILQAHAWSLYMGHSNPHSQSICLRCTCPH